MSYCIFCGGPDDGIGSNLLIVRETEMHSTGIYWHAHCYTSEKFDQYVLPVVNAYLDTIRIPLVPVMREALITELVRRQIDSKGYAVFNDLEGIRQQVATQFDELTKIEV